MPIILKRGTESNRPSLFLRVGEPIFTTDTRRLYVGSDSAPTGKEIEFGQLSASFVVASVVTASAIQSDEIRVTNLHVQTISASVEYYSGSTIHGSLSSNTHQFTGSLGVTGSMTVMGGNVGIGTIAPAARLDVSVASAPQAAVINLIAAGLSSVGDGAAISFLHTNSERTYRIYGYATGTNAGSLLFARGTSVGYTDTLTLGPTGNVKLNSYGAGTLITDSSGNVTATFDGRMKDISGSFDRGLDAIVNLSPKVYHWNEASGLNTEDVNVGLIAQEVLPFIPEAVGYKDDKYTMSDRPIIAALINAVKELKADNDQLRARIEALEA